MKKPNEEKRFQLQFNLDHVAERASASIQSNYYQVAPTLTEMMRRYGNDGMIDYDKHRIKLARKVVYLFQKHVSDAKKELIEAIRSLHSCTQGAIDILDGPEPWTFHSGSFDCSDEYHCVKNAQSEYDDLHRKLRDLHEEAKIGDFAEPEQQSRT